MAPLKIISNIAKHMPRTVHKARYFKHSHKWPSLNMDSRDYPSMWHYVVNHAIENKDNKRWALLADKYGVRKEIDSILGEDFLIPLLGVWDNPEDIDFDSLPDSFILKTNNGCGTNIFVHDKSTVDRAKVVGQLKKALKFPYPELSGQLHYSLIPPKIIAEKIMEQGEGKKSLTDYKIHCVNGEPLIIYKFEDRDEINHFDFNMMAYTTDWRPVKPGCDPDDAKALPVSPDKPECLNELLDVARKLSAGEEYVRIDLYLINDRIYLGEFTFTPDTLFNDKYRNYQKAMDFLLNRIKKGKAGKS